MPRFYYVLFTAIWLGERRRCAFFLRTARLTPLLEQNNRWWYTVERNFDVLFGKFYQDRVISADKLLYDLFYLLDLCSFHLPDNNEKKHTM